MNQHEILISVSDDIERQLQHHNPLAPAIIPTTISASLLVALLQKSIRRGRMDIALAAANTLQRAAPERLWRRLAVIAVEDIGIGDLDAVYLTIVASTQWRRLVRRFGGERFISLVVSRMASAAKCRACDDLYVVTQACPGWHDDRLELEELLFGDLLDVIGSDRPIERRAIAVSIALDTASASSAGALAEQRRRAEAVFDLLCEITPHTLAEVARTAYRQTGEPFCAFLPILHQQHGHHEIELRSDPLPPEAIVGGIPGWTYDKFSREGRAALNCFLRVDCATTDWLRLHVAPSDRLAALAHAVFRVESGLVADRLTWRTGENLRRQADLDSWSFSREYAAALLAATRADIGTLNRVREAAHVA